MRESFNEFCKLCSQIESEEDLKKFFSLILTLEEQAALGARLVIIKALIEGKLSQRQIAATYKVSIAQITRGSNALKIIDRKLYKLLEKQVK